MRKLLDPLTSPAEAMKPPSSLQHLRARVMTASRWCFGFERSAALKLLYAWPCRKQKTHTPKDVTIGSAHHLCLSRGLRPLWGLPLSLTYLIRPLKLINMNASRGQLKACLRKEGRRKREEKDGGDFRGRGFLCLRTMSWWLFKPLSGSGLIPRTAVMG